MFLSEIEKLDRNIKEARKIVERGNALERLSNNKDFKQIIGTGFFQEEAVRLVHLKADHNMQDPASQESITKQMDSIGVLSQYFNRVRHETRQAIKAIEADEETREELLREGLE